MCARTKRCERSRLFVWMEQWKIIIMWHITFDDMDNEIIWWHVLSSSFAQLLFPLAWLVVCKQSTVVVHSIYVHRTYTQIVYERRIRDTRHETQTVYHTEPRQATELSHPLDIIFHNFINQHLNPYMRPTDTVPFHPINQIWTNYGLPWEICDNFYIIYVAMWLCRTHTTISIDANRKRNSPIFVEAEHDKKYYCDCAGAAVRTKNLYSPCSCRLRHLAVPSLITISKHHAADK